MKNMPYRFDPTTSLFEHHFTKESIASEINYILSVSEMLEMLEDRRPKYFLIEEDGVFTFSSGKLSYWINNHILPQIARLGIRRMAIVSKSNTSENLKKAAMHIFPGLNIASFTTTEQARQWLLSKDIR